MSDNDALSKLIQDLAALVKRGNGLNLDIVKRYAEERENSRAIYQLFGDFEKRFAVFEKRQRDLLEELSDRLERLERLQLLEQTGHGRGSEAREIKSEIKQESQSLEWQLTRRMNNLLYLQEQATSYGAGQAPLEIINAITDEQIEVEKLQRKLQRGRYEKS